MSSVSSKYNVQQNKINFWIQPLNSSVIEKYFSKYSLKNGCHNKLRLVIT